MQIVETVAVVVLVLVTAWYAYSTRQILRETQWQAKSAADVLEEVRGQAQRCCRAATRY